MSKHVHILGICGTFMGGIAILARQLGYRVTGSDQNVYPPMSTALESHGIEILNGYKAEHLQPHPDIVVVGNACSRGNEAIEYVLNEGLTYFSGPAWLASVLLRRRHVLAVSGTHGKTSTTSMLTWILMQAGLNPGYLIGGVANNLPQTASIGDSPFFVIEADEYDTAFFDKRPKFLHYFPNTLIINNIEFDHADIYADVEAIKKEFHRLVKMVPGNGTILYPEQDKHIQDVLAKGCWSLHQPFVGETQIKAKLIKPDGSAFEVYYQDRLQGVVEWCMLGQHNVDNAMAAMTAAYANGVELEVAIAALNSFRGIRRRMEVSANVNGVTIYDDFAHHPTAIEKSLSALRHKVGKQSIIAVLQFGSNTMRLGGHDEQAVARSLVNADRVIILSAGLANVDLAALSDNLNAPVEIYGQVSDIVDHLKQQLRANDHVLIMSNKGFDGLQTKLADALQ